MHRLLTFAVIASIAAGSALAATDQQTVMKTCSGRWGSMSATERGATRRQDFMAHCMKAASPAMAMRPMGAGSMAMQPAAAGAMAMKPAADAGGSAKCKDGKTVTYKRRQGTCSGHGGVATWL